MRQSYSGEGAGLPLTAVSSETDWGIPANTGRTKALSETDAVPRLSLDPYEATAF